MSKRFLKNICVCLAAAFAGFLFLRSSFAQGASDSTAAHQLFSQANTAYKEGKFNVAIEGYEKLLQSGWESGNLYYNLGNCYFKKQEFGKAVLNYERAKLFMPNDSDLRSNYEYVLSLSNPGPQSFGNWFERLADRLFEGMTVDALTIFLSLLYAALMATLILHLSLALRRFTRPCMFILIALLSVAGVALHSKITYFNKGAVVIRKEAEAKFEPLESATTYFKLTEGSRVEVVEKAEEWYKIKRPDGRLGWVNKANIVRLTD